MSLLPFSRLSISKNMEIGYFARSCKDVQKKKDFLREKPTLGPSDSVVSSRSAASSSSSQTKKQETGRSASSVDRVWVFLGCFSTKSFFVGVLCFFWGVLEVFYFCFMSFCFSGSSELCLLKLLKPL